MRLHRPKVDEEGATTRRRGDRGSRLGLCLALSIGGFLGLGVAPDLIFAATPRAARASRAQATVAESLAAQAMADFKAGNHRRAIELYLAAWEQDRRDLTPLFNAARVAHTARLFERADGLYQRYLEQPDVPTSGRAAAERYRDEIRQARADLAADEASRLAAQGQHATAATAWRTAFRYAPERLHTLLAAARASRAAGAMDLAERDYEAFIARAPPGPARSDALTELEAVRVARRAAASATVQPPAPPAPTSARGGAVAAPTAVTSTSDAEPNPGSSAPPGSPAPTGSSPASASPASASALPTRAAADVVAPAVRGARPAWAWIGCGVGVAVAAIGTGGWIWAHDQATQLQAAIAPGAPPTWTRTAAQARARSLGHDLTLSVGAIAVGAAVAAAAGAVLLWPELRTEAESGSGESQALALRWTGRGVLLTRTF